MNSTVQVESSMNIVTGYHSQEYLLFQTRLELSLSSLPPLSSN